MKHITLILLIAFPLKLFSQAHELRSVDLMQCAYPFQIIGNEIVGSGADTLKKKIIETQFFMLGEEHSSPQISEFTNILLPYFASCGYKNFALEIGPFTANILQSEIQKNNSLYHFNNSFFKKHNDIPFPFFDEKKDELFLKTALQNNFKLWGIDQEYVTAPLFLIDEIYKNSKNSITIRSLYLQAKNHLETEFEKHNKKQENNYFKMFDSDNDFTRYIEQCHEPQQTSIIEAIKSSMDIYNKNESGEGNFPRMEYMKKNFAENYKIANKTGAVPKVFIKMGSMHLGLGKSWLGIYDVGNMITELAYFNNTKAVSINCFSRYIEDNNSTYDYMSSEEGKKISLILELATKDKWTLVDSEKIIKLATAKKIKLNDDLLFLLSKYNYILFAPLKTKPENNY